MGGADGCRMNAYIINGQINGEPNDPRWQTSYEMCTDLGFRCVRSPGIYARFDQNYQDTCTEYDKGNAGNIETFTRGCMWAHRNVMKKIAEGPDDRVVVFEDDINIPTDIDKAKQLIHDELERTKETADISFLGHCFDRTLCAHAMAVTKDAATKMVHKLNWCSNYAVDEQIRDLCAQGGPDGLNCEFIGDYHGDYVYPAWAEGVVRQRNGETMRNDASMKVDD